jgi:hypothetical protein
MSLFQKLAFDTRSYTLGWNALLSEAPWSARSYIGRAKWYV